MIITSDTNQIATANEFGEVLRDHVFTDQYGCYSCFDLIDGFQKADFTEREFELLMERPRILKPHEDEWGWDDAHVMKAAQWHVNIKSDIEVGWYWDGDGTLYIRCEGRAVISDDCKKDYVWRWANEVS